MYKGGMEMSGKKSGGTYGTYLIGPAAMLVMTVAMVLVLPLCILNEYLPMEYTKIAVIISMAFIALFGSIIVGMPDRDRAGERIAVSVCSYYLVHIFVAIFVFDGLTMHMLYEALACATGGFGGWLLLIKRKTTLSKRKKQRANR